MVADTDVVHVTSAPVVDSECVEYRFSILLAYLIAQSNVCRQDTVVYARDRYKMMCPAPAGWRYVVNQHRLLSVVVFLTVSFYKRHK